MESQRGESPQTKESNVNAIETQTFALGGFAKEVVETLAGQEGVTCAEALALILIQTADQVARGLLLGGYDGKELLTEVRAGLPKGELPVHLHRDVVVYDSGEAIDLVNEVRNAWNETPEAADGGFASWEHEETSYALDALENGNTGTWELTFPNGDTLTMTLADD